MSILFRAWGVVCSKGNSVFLDHTRANEYAAKMHGTVIDLSTTYVKETSNHCLDIRQEGAAYCERAEFVSEESPTPGESCESCGTRDEDISPCGNCSSGTD